MTVQSCAVRGRDHVISLRHAERAGGTEHAMGVGQSYCRVEHAAERDEKGGNLPREPPASAPPSQRVVHPNEATTALLLRLQSKRSAGPATPAS